jgi:hypothetical protein
MSLTLQTTARHLSFSPKVPPMSSLEYINKMETIYFMKN